MNSIFKYISRMVKTLEEKLGEYLSTKYQSVAVSGVGWKGGNRLKMGRKEFYAGKKTFYILFWWFLT